MRRTMLWLSIVGLLLSACGGMVSPTPAPTPTPLPSPTPSPTVTPDVQATVDAAVAATATAVAAEATAEPTPLPEEVLTEEELNAAIEEAVYEAMSAYEQAYAYTEESYSDGELTEEEIETLYAYYAYADELIALAEAYILLYDDLYADLIEETIVLLEEVEDDLVMMEDSLEDVVAILDAVVETVEAGQEVRQETLDQVAQAVEGYQQVQQEVASAWQNWEQQWEEVRAQRLQAIQEIAPSFVPASRAEVLLEMVKYADAVRGALEDYSLSSEELANIAQLSANLLAGLQEQGPVLKGLADPVRELTGRLAQGDLPGAIEVMSELMGRLKGISGLPALPEFTPPAPPALPVPPKR